MAEDQEPEPVGPYGSAARVEIGWPTVAAIVLGLVGGAAQVVNYALVPASEDLHAGIGVGLYFVLGAGLPPLTGTNFRAALHCPAWLSGILGSLTGALLLAVTTISMAPIAHETIAALVTILSAWGFSASMLAVSVKPR